VPIAQEAFNRDTFEACPNCESLLQAHVFPAASRSSTVTSADAALIAGESSCFYHPHKPAVIACESCGRFLCGLCDVEFGDQHLCPSCLQSGRQTRKLHTLENQRTLYDGIALTLATVPILMWPLTFITAPAALFIVVRHWRSPLSVVPRTRVRYVLAALFAIAQIAGWLFIFYTLFLSYGRVRHR
jgi:hypothetical protein